MHLKKIDHRNIDSQKAFTIALFIIPIQILLLFISIYFGIIYFAAIAAVLLLIIIPFVNLELSLSILLFLFIFFNRPMTASFAFKIILIQDAFFVIILTAWLLRRLLNDELFDIQKSPLVKAYICFILVGCIATIIGFFNGNRLYDILFEVREIIYLLTFFIVLDVVRSKKQIFLLLGTFVVSTNLYAIESIIGSVARSKLITHAIGELRYVEPTSVFLSLAIVFCVSILLLGNINRYLRYMLFGSILIMVTALILSLTRGYWLGAAGGLLFVFLYLPRKRKFTVLLLSFVLLSIGIIGASVFLGFSPKLIFDLVTARASTLRFVTYDPSAMARIVEVQTIIKDIPKYLFFGKGLGAALYLYKYDKRIWMEWTYFHNNYIEMLFKMGLIGIIAYSIKVFYFFKSGITSLKTKNTMKKAIIVALLGMYVGMMVTSLTSGVILFLDTAPLIGIIMGIIVVIQSGLITDNNNSLSGSM